LNFGIEDNYDYILVISGKSKVSIPKRNNLKVIHRENNLFDYGGYIDLVDKFKNQLLKMDYLFFINNSTRGPFSLDKVISKWYERFLSEFKIDTHLVGSSINILTDKSNYVGIYNNFFKTNKKVLSHVQTTAYAVDKFGFNLLLEEGFFNNKSTNDKNEVIATYEIRLSQIFIEKNFNIGCILDKYKLDFRNVFNDVNFSSRDGDSLYKNSYFGKTLNPYDLVFIKTNRDLITPLKLYIKSIKNLEYFNKSHLRFRFYLFIELIFSTKSLLVYKSKVIIKKFFNKIA